MSPVTSPAIVTLPLTVTSPVNLPPVKDKFPSPATFRPTLLPDNVNVAPGESVKVPVTEELSSQVMVKERFKL